MDPSIASSPLKEISLSEWINDVLEGRGNCAETGDPADQSSTLVLDYLPGMEFTFDVRIDGKVPTNLLVVNAQSQGWPCI